MPGLRARGAKIVLAVTHQREPNDNKLAENIPPGLVDIILGGHDHYYAHSLVNSTHVLRSGTDFKQLSYIEAWSKQGGGWDFNITRRDIVRAIPEDPAIVTLVNKLTSSLKAKLEKPIGYTSTPLDARFKTVRTRESNLGNFVCDLMRFYYNADCVIMAAGTIRGDQIYPPGILRLKDILNCFPFEDPVVLLKVKGQAILDALENSVSLVPALEGRFPQVSNIHFGFKPSAPPGSRITFAQVGGKDIDLEKYYILTTRGYMARGKDGFTSLLARSEGGEAEELVPEEGGVMISTILRQYFLSLKVLGKWRHWCGSLDQHWGSVHQNLHCGDWLKPPSATPSPMAETTPKCPTFVRNGSTRYYYGRYQPPENIEQELDGGKEDQDDMDSDSDSDPDILTTHHPQTNYVTHNATSATEEERRLRIARSVIRKWMRLAGLEKEIPDCVDDACAEFTPQWTAGIAPKVEGRIIIEE